MEVLLGRLRHDAPESGLLALHVLRIDLRRGRGHITGKGAIVTLLWVVIEETGGFSALLGVEDDQRGSYDEVETAGKRASEQRSVDSRSSDCDPDTTSRRPSWDSDEGTPSRFLVIVDFLAGVKALMIDGWSTSVLVPSLRYFTLVLRSRTWSRP